MGRDADETAQSCPHHVYNTPFLSPVHIMFTIPHLLPKTVIEALDARRRAFLWTGDTLTITAPALSMSHPVGKSLCQQELCGGLGIKNLEDKNHYLLMKFVHKLHDPATLPWKTFL
jgi:hypothetical protein